MTPLANLPFTTDELQGKKFHFIGIGGCGMSGLAKLLSQLGASVRGTDLGPTSITEDLSREGIEVEFQQDGHFIDADCSVVVASAAIPEEHLEILAAEELGIPVLSYAKVLGLVQRSRTSVCIAGTHGKSTTVSMLSAILLHANLDPSFIVGATCEQIGGSSRVGSEKISTGPREGQQGILVCESCEFNRSFHDHEPESALIHNVEEDHLDVYGSIDAIIESFRQFALRVPHENEGGYLLIGHDNAHRQNITPGLKCKVETFGFHPESDYQVVFDPAVRRVGILRDGMWTIQWTNPMPGSHNALNSAAAAIHAVHLGVDWTDIVLPLENFGGVERRLQRLGTITSKDGGRVIVYDDYGHHPTEIELTLNALRAAELPKRLICVFQPHQHSRTRFLLDQFAQSFSSADVVIVPHIYFVRDSMAEKQRVSAQDLVDRLTDRGSAAIHINDFDDIAQHVRKIAKDGDLIVIMGAGPVTTIGHSLVDSPLRVR